MPDDSPYAGMMEKVVRVRKRWSYRILYAIGRRWIEVHSITPSWLGAADDNRRDD
jgi:hypothetical protein